MGNSSFLYFHMELPVIQICFCHSVYMYVSAYPAIPLELSKPGSDRAGTPPHGTVSCDSVSDFAVLGRRVMCIKCGLYLALSIRSSAFTSGVAAKHRTAASGSTR